MVRQGGCVDSGEHERDESDSYWTSTFESMDVCGEMYGRGRMWREGVSVMVM